MSCNTKHRACLSCQAPFFPFSRPILDLHSSLFPSKRLQQVALSIIWGLVSTMFVVFLPLWESKDSITQVMSGICGGGSRVGDKEAAPSAE